MIFKRRIYQELLEWKQMAAVSSGYKTHKSFDCFRKKYPIKLEEHYVIYSKDLKYEDGILYIPFYMAACL